MSTLPTLFKMSQTGAVQFWQTGAHPKQLPDRIAGEIVTHFGQVGGAIQTTSDVIIEGKNIGRANQTTPLQQAQAEALAKWTKKKEREGYVESLERAQAGETDKRSPVAPMLAQDHAKTNGRHIKYPCHAQRKLDGVRCIADIVVRDSLIDVSLWSRKGEEIVVPAPHVISALRAHFSPKPVGRYILDGELYRHGWSLQQVASYARQKTTPKPGYEQLGYHIYDLVSTDAFAVRTALLKGLLRKAPAPLHFVETIEIDSFEEAKTQHDAWVAEGYEGLMFRNSAAGYQAGRRSPDLQKLKEFQDGEYEIISVWEGRGKFAGLAMFTCRTPEGKAFDCCAPGSLEDRRELLKYQDDLIGGMLTVKYFDLTDEGIPHFPVGKALRSPE